MGKHYSHLSSEERAMIQLEIDNGASMRSAAQWLGRHPSSISRELARNRPTDQPTYQATVAACHYQQRREVPPYPDWAE